MVLYPTADEIRQRQEKVASARASLQSMAGQQGQSSQQRDRYLSPNQQDLLLAALTSQAGKNTQTSEQVGDERFGNPAKSEPAATMTNTNGNGLYMSPQQAELDSFNADYTPDLDYLDGDNFDFEDADLGGEMIGALPSELHEKRKMSEDDGDEEEGDAKRQETQEGEKSAKKPGRKPLTNEPTTKRKAQNRAAQRAFRERKEKHLKDLETTVTDLTKAKEADKHENGLLKAQIERLQIELREYRKRLTLNGGSGANRSPPLSGTGAPGRTNSGSPNYGGSAFSFDFPKFGALPGSQIFGNQSYNNSSGSLAQRDSVTPPITQSPSNNGSFSGPSNRQQSQAQSQSQSRSGSTGRSMSPRSASASNHASPSSQPGNINPAFTTYSTNNNMHGFASTLPQMNGNGNDPFGDLFSPSILKTSSVDSNGNYFNNTPQTNGSAKVDNSGGGETIAGLNRVFQFNSNGSTSDSASPSASSASQWNANANSSCDTSPEPSHDSPANKSKGADTFYDQNDVSKNGSGQLNTNQSFNNQQFGDGAYNMPSLDTFDPVLFGGYREDQDPLLNGGDFTGGFFDEALNPAPFDLGSPSNLFGILQSPQQTNSSLNAPSGAANAPTPSRNLMAEMDKARDGGDDDYGLPGCAGSSPAPSKATDSGKLISCNNIWNQLQSNPDFQEGKFDLDGLCSELRAKARCSESGVMVDQQHVDAALRKLGKKDDKTGQSFEAPAGLMFEQESWDNVLKRLGGSG
ncbi:DNA-binding transcription factor yap1 [Saxophila tyrrhenica]|uniref:DNA-binding transcription factor yap1 n=1 Tax=Saxophila tyrrhenica TaxID=1690608 RepID=A0AAV9NW42_9PEZI|nr:DNA-binding transcription factor yap1 [Saxophila tyrrhenica]